MFAVGFLTVFADKKKKEKEKNQFRLSSCFQPFLPVQERSISPMAWGILPFITRKHQKKFLNIYCIVDHISWGAALPSEWEYTSSIFQRRPSHFLVYSRDSLTNHGRFMLSQAQHTLREKFTKDRNGSNPQSFLKNDRFLSMLRGVWRLIFHLTKL